MSVQLLNELSEFFLPSNWHVDLITIIGNHDMILREGGGNSMDVFAKINPKITVISLPTVWENALLVPYEHDLDTFKQTIDAHRGNPNIRVIFGHFDTIGARMNSNVVSARGIEGSYFPSGVPVYSGHYHSASTHNGVCYIGSAYETSMSEAGDQKRMLQFGHNWSRLPDLPLNLGPKHSKITETTTEAEIEALLSRGIHAQDKIVFDRLETLPKRLVEACEAVGARPIVRKKRRTLAVVEEETGPDAASLTPEVLFTQHLAVNPQTANDAELLDAALEQIRTNGTFGSVIPEAKDIRFLGLELDNFGPFKGHHTLDLSDPGVALVLAERAQGEQGSSNGCGKSLLTSGAVLFALTGQADPRPTMEGGKSSGASVDLVHHGKEFLTVRLTGEVNGVGFRITRRVVKKKPSLTYETQEPTMTWTSHTRTTMKLTQSELINSELLNLPDDGTDPSKQASGFLLRTVVWNQHAAPGLLEQGNGQAKKVLRTLVQAEAWEALSQLQKDHAKGYKADAQRASDDKVRAEAAMTEAQDNIVREEERRKKWDAEQSKTLAGLAAEEANAKAALKEAEAKLASVVVPASCAKLLEKEVADSARLTHEIAAADRAIRCSPPFERELSDRKAPEELAAELLALELRATELTTQQSQASGQLAVARARLSEWRMKLVRFEKGTAKPECDHCSQPITAGHRESHVATFRTRIQSYESESSEASAVVRECTAQRARLTQRRTVILALQCTAVQRGKVAEARETKAAAIASLTETQARLGALRATEESRNTLANDRRQCATTVHQAGPRVTYLSQQLNRQATLVNPSILRLEAFQARRTTTSASLLQATQDVDEATALKECHATLATLMGKDGVPNQLCLRMLRILEETAGTFFESMSSDMMGFSMGFDDKGKLEKKVTMGSGERLALNLLSGGELRRLQLAGFLAYSDVALRHRRLRINLRVLDEPMQGIDGVGMRAFLTAVKRSFVSKHVLLISHRPYETSFAFDSVVKIRCVNGVSTISNT